MDARIGFRCFDTVIGDIDGAGDFRQINAIGQFARALHRKHPCFVWRQFDGGFTCKGNVRLRPQIGQHDRRTAPEFQVAGQQVDIYRRSRPVEQSHHLVAIGHGLDQDLRIIGIIGDDSLIARRVLVDSDKIGIAPDIQQGLRRLSQIIAD